MERWNTHWSTSVDIDVLGQQLCLRQDPASYNLGTTVWDASLVFAKFLERQKQGEFARARVRGRRALELGAGAGGLCGMALALLGAHVVLTDFGEVLPLLRANAEYNVTPQALKAAGDAAAAATVGSVEVGELDWDREETWAAFSPPYDYILAADCVYNEVAVPRLLAAVLRMAGPRTVVAICNEFRSQSVHDVFTELFSRHFTIKQVPVRNLDPKYQHPLIKIFLLKLRKALPLCTSSSTGQGSAAGGGGSVGGQAATAAGAASCAAAEGGGEASQAAGTQEADLQAAGASASAGASSTGAAAEAAEGEGQLCRGAQQLSLAS